MKRLLFLLICLLTLNSCSKISERLTLPQTLERFKSEKIVQKQDLAISEDKKEITHEEVSLPEYRQIKSKPSVQEEVLDIESINISEDKVIINADRAPLFDFIMYVFGEVLKVPFMIEEDIRNITTPVTLRTPEPIPSRDALKMIIEILNKNEIKVSTRGGALYIYKQKVSPAAPPQSVSVAEDIPLSAAQVMQIIPLKYIKSSDLIPVITEIYRGMVNVKAFAKENSIIITGSGFQIKNIMEFIKTVDVPYFENKKVMMIKLTYWRPEEFVKQLSEILQSIGISVAKSQNEPGVFLVPIKYLNSLLAVTPDENSKKILSEWVNRLDTPESAGTEEKIFTYSPLYIRASDLVEAVKKLYTGQTTQTQPTSAPLTTKPTEPKALTPQPEKPTLTTAFSLDFLKISSDDRRNIVIVISTPSTYKMLLELFKELDKPTRQVLIETVIAEVTLKDDLKYGVEWYIKNKMAEGTYTLQTLGQLGVSTTGGLIFQFVSDTQKFKALINLFAEKNLINILSTPRLLVLDNEEATINVGMDVPIVTGEQTTTGITATGEVGVVRTYQYRTTGITLKVKPTINTEGLLTLNITQEVSQAQTNKISAIESPIILLRKINTSITAPSDHTIVLGGLIEENKSLTETKVPLLGDIPLLGYLFKNTSEGTTKTELIIMLTPKILSTVDDLIKITEDLKKEFFKGEKQ